MEITKLELLELLQAQEIRKSQRNHLWLAYLGTRGKEATSYLKKWSFANDELHSITMKIASLTLNLIYNE